MKIGVDINEVLRAFQSSFETVYTMNYGSDGVKKPIDTYNLLNHFEFEDKVVVEKYINDSAPQFMMKHDLLKRVKEINDDKEKDDETIFDNVIEYNSVSDEFNKFVYEEYIFDLFANAPIIDNCAIYLNQLIFDLKNDHDIYIVGTDEKFITVPFTNSFLSKNSIKSRYQIFTKKPEECWDFVDVMITTNPKVLLSKPENKKTIKINKEYNKDIISDVEIDSIKDLTIENKLKNILQ